MALVAVVQLFDYLAYGWHTDCTYYRASKRTRFFENLNPIEQGKA